jgi:hypothetical protein
MMKLLALVLAFALPACGLGSQELVSSCLDDPTLCPACSTNADCVITSNLCHENAYCSHKDAPIFVTQDGCSAEYRPPDEACACIQNVCQANKTFCAIPEGCD